MDAASNWMAFARGNSGFYNVNPAPSSSSPRTGPGATGHGTMMKPTSSSTAVVPVEEDEMEAGMDAAEFGYTTTDPETSGSGNPLGDFGTWDYETEFCERIGRLNYFYSLKKLPIEESRGSFFHGFELHFWPNSDPIAKEVVLGHRMCDISQAKRSAFAAGVEKLPRYIQVAPPPPPVVKRAVPVPPRYGLLTPRPTGASGLAKAPPAQTLVQDGIDGKPMASSSQSVSHGYFRDRNQHSNEPMPIASTSKGPPSPLGSRFFNAGRNDPPDSVQVLERREERPKAQEPFFAPSPEAEHAEYQRPARQSVSDENFKVLIPRGTGSIVLESYRQWRGGRGGHY